MPSSATQQNWIDATRRLVLGAKQEERNTLAEDYVTGSGVLVMTGSLSGIVPGVRLSVGLSTYYVRSVNQAGLVVNVIDSQEGSIDQAPVAGSTVWVAPRFSEFEIFEAVKAELHDLSAPDNGLFQIRSVDLTAANATWGYDLVGVTEVIDIYDVLVARSGGGLLYERVPKVAYRFDEGLDAAIFPSGYGLQFHRPVTEYGNTIRVYYRTGFTVTDDPAALMSDTGLPATAWDIVPLGAAMRLVAPREIARNSMQGQGDTRRAAEVPPGAIAASFRSVGALRAQRIQSEAARLVAKYPDRRL